MAQTGRWGSTQVLINFVGALICRLKGEHSRAALCATSTDLCSKYAQFIIRLYYDCSDVVHKYCVLSELSICSNRLSRLAREAGEFMANDVVYVWLWSLPLALTMPSFRGAFMSVWRVGGCRKAGKIKGILKWSPPGSHIFCWTPELRDGGETPVGLEVEQRLRATETHIFNDSIFHLFCSAQRKIRRQPNEISNG